jgi:hypothetical protein
MGFQIKQTRTEILPGGEYPAEIATIEAADGQFGPQLKITFDLLDRPGRSLMGWCSQKFSPKSKLYLWTKAAFGGHDIPPAWTFDSDRLIGKKVILSVVRRRDDDGDEYNRIDNVLSWHNGSQQQTPVVETPAPAMASEPDMLDLDETELLDPGSEFTDEIPW